MHFALNRGSKQYIITMFLRQNSNVSSQLCIECPSLNITTCFVICQQLILCFHAMKVPQSILPLLTWRKQLPGKPASPTSQTCSPAKMIMGGGYFSKALQEKSVSMFRICCGQRASMLDSFWKLGLVMVKYETRVFQ